jgi:hypothetical protein
VPPIDCGNFLSNSSLIVSVEVMIKFDGHVRNVRISNTRDFIVPEVPDFSRGHFSRSVDQHQSP